jgi:benzylsuccinate CoA-transferase BbsE subunit
MPATALDGVRVVEFSDEVGTYCGRLLADLGAEVIKVEPPGGGFERHVPPFFHDNDGPDTSLGFWVLNTSKKSVVLDLDSPEGQQTARKLALSADIVIEDYPVGYLAERDLGFESMHREKPSLVYVSITGFGQTGPHAGFAFSDIVGQAMGGIMTLAGEPADPPNMIVGMQANMSASVHAAQGALLALIHAETNGEGQLVDVSAQEALSMSQETAMQTWDFQKRNRVRTGERGMLPIALPAVGVYPTTDGHVTLFVMAPGGADFPALVDWMRDRGMAGDLDEEPYASLIPKLNMATITQYMMDPGSAQEVIPQLAHVNELVKAFIASMSSVEAYEEGQGRNLLVGIVSTPETLAQNAQLRARDWYVGVGFDYLQTTVQFPGPPYRLSETPAAVSRPPRLGEHTEEVLATLV